MSLNFPGNLPLDRNLAGSHLTAYVRDVNMDNASSILAGFAKAAAGEADVKAVSQQDFAGAPCVIAEYARTLPALSTPAVPWTNEKVTLHQLRAALPFPQGKRPTILEVRADPESARDRVSRLLG